MIDEPKTDKEWQAQYDAQTLAQAEEIKADETRLAAAQAQAKKMVENKREEAKAMAKVAGKRERGTGGQSGGQTNPFNVGARLDK